MKKETKSLLKLEIIWWFFSILVAFFIMYPIMQKVPSYPFFQFNAFMILIAITLARYIFLLKHSWLANQKWIKRIIIGCSVFIIFWLIMNLGDFNSYMKEQGLQGMLDHLHVNEQTNVVGYIKKEMIFFGVAAIIGAIALPFRLIISLWRVRNKTGKV